MPSLAQSRSWLADGDTAFASALPVDQDALDAPSLLPGWTRKHVLAHVASNAEALGNLLTWAATGVETPMYASREQRDAAIEAGAALEVSELLAWHRQTTLDFRAAADELAPDRWDVVVRNGQGAPIAARLVPWLRARELFVHAVDLETGTGFADLPAELLTEICAGTAAFRAAQEDPQPVSVLATDSGARWDLSATASVLVQAPLAELAAYLTGRPHQARLDSGEPAPDLPRWL